MGTTWGACLARWAVRIVLVVLSWLAALAILPPRWANLVFVLPLGWLRFLQRVLPEVSVNASAIGLGVICSVLIIAGIQWLATSFRAHAPGSSARWRWSWSVAVYGSVWLLFLAAMGITGLVHQLAWMMRSKDPIYVVREPAGVWMGALMSHAGNLALLAQEARWDVAATRAALFAEQPVETPGRQVRTPQGPRSEAPGSAIEDLQVVFVPNSAGQMNYAVVFFRDPGRLEQSGFVVVRRDNVSEIQPARDLPAALARAAQESAILPGTAR